MIFADPYPSYSGCGVAAADEPSPEADCGVTVQAVDALPVHRMPVPPQQHVQPAVADAAALMR
jgi:hypothetical protein